MLVITAINICMKFFEKFSVVKKKGKDKRINKVYTQRKRKIERIFWTDIESVNNSYNFHSCCVTCSFLSVIYGTLTLVQFFTQRSLLPGSNYIKWVIQNFVHNNSYSYSLPAEDIAWLSQSKLSLHKIP